MANKGTIVFFVIESVGHINPLISIFREVQRRGYKLIILTIGPLAMAPKLRQMNFTVEIVNENLLDSEKVRGQFMEDLKSTQSGGPMASFSKMCQNCEDTVFKTILDNYLETGAKLESLKPDLVVIDHLVIPPMKPSLKWVRFNSLFPSYLYAKYNPDKIIAGLGLSISEMSNKDKRLLVEEQLKALEPVKKRLAEMGSPEWQSNDFFVEPVSPYLNFYLGPNELGYEHEPGVKPLPADTFVRLEHTIDDEQLKVSNREVDDEFELPEKLRNVAGKLIYFSLGTIASASAQLLNKLLEYLANAPHKFIVSMGQNYQQVKLHSNMWGAKYVNQKAILKKVDLFITHGGHNSIIESFYFGVPRIIVMPVFADQYDSAQRVQDCSFGRRLDPFNCSQQELLEAIETLLSTPVGGCCKAATATTEQKDDDRMRNIGLRMRAGRYYQLAADKLEQQLIGCGSGSGETSG